MVLEREIDAQRRAIGDLRRARSSSSAWHDEQRRRLDEQRLAVLEEAAMHLLAALSSAQELVASADRLLQQR